MCDDVAVIVLAGLLFVAVVLALSLFLGWLLVHALGVFGVGPGSTSLANYVIVGLAVLVLLGCISFRAGGD